MESFRTFLYIALAAICFVLYFKWIDFSAVSTQQLQPVAEQQRTDESGLPVEQPAELVGELVQPAAIVDEPTGESFTTAQLIRVETDLVIAFINPQGGVLERMELKQAPITREQPEVGFPILKKNEEGIFVVRDGFVANSRNDTVFQATPYAVPQTEYQLGDQAYIDIPLTWQSPAGIQFTKTWRFKRDSYVVEVSYQIANNSDFTK